MTSMRHIGQFLAALGAAVIAIMTVIVVASVIARYLVGSPFPFTEEAVGLLFCLSAFLPLMLTLIDRNAILVGPRDQPNDRPNLTLFRQIGRDLATFIFLAILAKLMFDYATQSYSFGARAPASGLLIHPWAFAVTGVTAFVAFFLLVRIARGVVKRVPETPDSGD